MSSSVWLWLMLVSLPLASIASAIYASLSRVGPATLLNSTKTPSEALLAIADNPERHASSIGLLRALLVILLGVSTTMWVSGAGRDSTPGLLDALLGVVLGAALFWIPGVVFASAISRHAGPGVIRVWASPIRLIATAFGPAERVSRFVDEVVRRLAGPDSNGSNEGIAPELLSAVEEHQRDGQIDLSAREMIEAVFEFGTTMVEEIMTPRTEIEALEYTDDIDAVKRYVRKAGHSRIPVYESDLDHIVGVLYAKDLLHWLVDEGSKPGATFTLRKLLRQPTFVPETKTLRELLQELISGRVHVAIAADEYGGTSGLVTLEDIVEEIFGDIEDEYEQDDELPSVDVDPLLMTAEIDARKHVDDANDALEPIGLELPSSEHYDTVGGFVVVGLGRIPDPGEVVELEGLRILIIDAEPTRVVRVRIERITTQLPSDTTGDAIPVAGEQGAGNDAATS